MAAVTDLPPAGFDDLVSLVQERLGCLVVRADPLPGGMVADAVIRIVLDDGRVLVSKTARGDRAHLDVEARMIETLHAARPEIVPEVVHAEPQLLLQTFRPGDHLTEVAAASLGRELARLHDHTAPSYGFDGPTLNGWFVLPNGWSPRWVPFFADRRLRYCADAAVANGTLGRDRRDRVERLCERLPELLTEPDRPALLHGDLWRGNILATGDSVSGLIDPSVVYGHPELDLASIVGQPYADVVLAAYAGAGGVVEAGFLGRRASIYQVYPAIMHVLYFGERYEPWLDRVLSESGV